MADRKFRVVVAGAGMSGLFMAETLKRARIDFTVYEKANMRPQPRSGPISRKSRATAASPSSSASTRRSSTFR
jgi:2-polyprenyl-6-methoxyphenol hydroxylase-like FAD-dependent oxidoreductase